MGERQIDSVKSAVWRLWLTLKVDGREVGHQASKRCVDGGDQPRSRRRLDYLSLLRYSTGRADGGLQASGRQARGR